LQNSENLPPQKSLYHRAINPSNFHQFQKIYNHPPYGFALQVLLRYKMCNYIVKIHGNKGSDIITTWPISTLIILFLETLKISKTDFFFEEKIFVLQRKTLNFQDYFICCNEKFKFKLII
jgi:hypothetical protein